MRRRHDRIEVLAHLARALGNQRPGIPRRIKRLGPALDEYEDGRDLWRADEIEERQEARSLREVGREDEPLSNGAGGGKTRAA
jgi:hypothetical protein